MTDLGKLSDREKANLRQKKYYESNKERINAKRRKCVCVEAEAEQASSGVVPKTFSDLVAALKGLEINENTQKKYIADLNRLNKIVSINNVKKDLNNANNVIAELETYEQPNGEAYSINTVKGMIQIILFVIDNLKIEIENKNMQRYRDVFQKYKALSSEHTATNKTTNIPDIDFPTYLERIKDKFGAGSKEYLIANLYHELPLRDDLSNLIIVNFKKEAKDDTNNYIIIPKKGKATVVINEYKTSGKYGQIKESLTLATTKILRSYMEAKHLEYGGFLFQDKLLSSFVSKMNKKIGLKGSITFLRKLTVTDNKDMSLDERIQLANKMKHSFATSKATYEH